MTIEYLINSENVIKYKDFINKFNASKETKNNQVNVKCSSTEIKEKTTVFGIFTDDNNSKCAKILSSLDEELKELMKLEEKSVLITDEVSAYYNESLFPYINRFERLLRRLLCIKVSFLDDNEKIDVEIDKKNKEDIRETIKRLDEMDFGKIHDCFFVDKALNERIRNELNNNPSKTELINCLLATEDNSFWSKNIEEKELLPIRDHFLELKEYRNDVMHAHRVNYKKYNKALKLFKNINKSLEKATTELIKPIHDQNSLKNLAEIAKSVVNIIGAIEERIQLDVNKYADAFSGLCEFMAVMRNGQAKRTLEDMSLKESTFTDVSVASANNSLNDISLKKTTLQSVSKPLDSQKLEEISSKQLTLQDASIRIDNTSLEDISQRQKNIKTK